MRGHHRIFTSPSVLFMGMAAGLMTLADVCRPCSGAPGDIPSAPEAIALTMLKKYHAVIRRNEAHSEQPIITVDLTYRPATDTDLQALRGLKDLQQLRLGLSKVTDAGLKEIGGFKNLELLDLSDLRVTDAGLKDLRMLRKLRWLSLHHTRGVTPTGLKELKGLENLQTLRLDNHLLTDVGLQSLREIGLLHALEEAKAANDKRPARAEEVVFLNLGGYPVTGTGLKELQILKSLQTLHVAGPQVTTNAGLQEIKELKSLQTLGLFNASVTETGLRELLALEKLRSLDLRGSQITSAGLRELQAMKGLQTLGLSKILETDPGLNELKKLKNLQTLILHAREVNDDVLRTLQKANLLHVLQQASARGGARPAHLEDIVTLDLRGMKLTDVGLKALLDLKHLEAVDVRFTQVTEAGLKEFQAALPKCRIMHSL